MLSAADRLMNMRDETAYLVRVENGEEVVSVEARQGVSDLVEVRPNASEEIIGDIEATHRAWGPGSGAALRRSLQDGGRV